MIRLLLVVLLAALPVSASAQGNRPAPKPAPSGSFWGGCITVQNGSDTETAYVSAFDRLTPVGPGDTAQICQGGR